MKSGKIFVLFYFPFRPEDKEVIIVVEAFFAIVGILLPLIICIRYRFFADNTPICLKCPWSNGHETEAIVMTERRPPTQPEQPTESGGSSQTVTSATPTEHIHCNKHVINVTAERADTVDIVNETQGDVKGKC